MHKYINNITLRTDQQERVRVMMQSFMPSSLFVIPTDGIEVSGFSTVERGCY